MKLGQLVLELNDIMDKEGMNLDVYFDTEAAAYNVHVVPIDKVYAEIDPRDDGKKVLILFTNQEEVRTHWWAEITTSESRGE